MADQPYYPGTGDATSTAAGNAASTKRPRWKVTVLIVIAVVLLLLMVVLHVTGVVGANTNG